MGALNHLTKPRLPILKYGDPLTRGLVFDAPMFEGSGTTVDDDASSLLDKILGTLTSATWDRNLLGIDLDFSAAASVVSYSSPSIVNSLTQLSLEFFLYIRGNGGGSLGRIMHKKNNSKGYFQLFTQTTTIAFDIGLAVADSIQTIPQPSLNVWHHLVITCGNLSSAATTTSFYLDGISQTVTNQQGGSGAIVADDTNLYIGNRGDGIRNFNGKMAYARIWNRVLSQKEVIMLYQNPWRIYRQYKPRFPRVYY